MRKYIAVIGAAAVLVFTACTAKKEKSIFEKMAESSAAVMESADGTGVRVWNTDDIASLAEMKLKETVSEPADPSEDWLYRIVYNPAVIVKGGKEIIVLFCKDYIQIGSEYYVPEQGVNYEDILEWAQMKFDWLVKEYGEE